MYAFWALSGLIRVLTLAMLMLCIFFGVLYLILVGLGIYCKNQYVVPYFVVKVNLMMALWFSLFLGPGLPLESQCVISQEGR